jgi:hypothetical protein
MGSPRGYAASDRIQVERVIYAGEVRDQIMQKIAGLTTRLAVHTVQMDIQAMEDARRWLAEDGIMQVAADEWTDGEAPDHRLTANEVALQRRPSPKCSAMTSSS